MVEVHEPDRPMPSGHCLVQFVQRSVFDVVENVFGGQVRHIRLVVGVQGTKAYIPAGHELQGQQDCAFAMSENVVPVQFAHTRSDVLVTRNVELTNCPGKQLRTGLHAVCDPAVSW